MGHVGAVTTRTDLAIYQGDDYAAVVTVTQNGVDPADVLSGYAAQACLRVGYADQGNTQYVTQMDATVDSPDITLFLSHNETVKLLGDYRWDVQVIAPDGIVTTVLYGIARVIPEVTRL